MKTTIFNINAVIFSNQSYWETDMKFLNGFNFIPESEQ